MIILNFKFLLTKYRTLFNLYENIHIKCLTLININLLTVILDGLPRQTFPSKMYMDGFPDILANILSKENDSKWIVISRKMNLVT